MRRVIRSLTFFAAACFIPSLVCAQATTPATTAQGQNALTARITAVSGMFVEARGSSEARWEVAKVGMVLSEGAELRTGPKSAIQFAIPPDQTITLDRLGVLQILRANFQDGKIVTDIGMRYGRTRYDIDAQGREHDAKVHSPSSVLAIRGTDVVLYDQPPFAPQAVSLTGRAMFRDAKKQVAFGGPGQGKTKITENDETAAGTALATTVADPRGRFSGRTQTDDLLKLSLAAYGGSDFSNLGVLALFDQARAGTFKGSFAGALPIGRQLSFNLFWNGSPLSDVDLSVTSPRGEVVSPTSVNVPSSGHYLGNNVADETGVGQEQIVWEISYPIGRYTIRAALVSGQTATTDIFVIDDPLGTGQVVGNLSGTLTPNSPTLQGNVTATGAPQATPQKVVKKSAAAKTKVTKTAVAKPAVKKK